MIINERFTSYLHSMEDDVPSFFEELRKKAEADHVPIIRRESERFLKMLLAIHKPEFILEIGTGVAYSALVFAASCKQVKQITTIENYPPRIESAKANINDFYEQELRQREDLKIDLLEEDAVRAVSHLKSPFDFIFLDGPKAQYIVMLPDLVRLLKPGGVMVADNVLQEGDLIESRFVTPRRQRTIHERMRTFIWETMHHAQLTSSLLTVGDGMIVSVKNDKQ